jgi:CheY-like chemotaxis protein
VILPFPTPESLPVTDPALDKLRVMVIGLDAAVARDVVRLLASEGAEVVAADASAAKLALLEEDLAPHGQPIETAWVDLASDTQLRRWRLRGWQDAQPRAFDLIVCCCGAPARDSALSGAVVCEAGPADVALGDHANPDCPALAAQRVLQPTLFLHAEPLRRAAFDRALAVLRHPTLRGLLERRFIGEQPTAAGALPYMRIAAHVYSLCREADAAPARLTLVPPSFVSTPDAAPDVASAA